MKILHTSDIHLREYQDERWKALQDLLALGKKYEIDALAICGDLFDKDIDAENLRPQIRQLFSNTGFKVLIIPGNHDKDAYLSGMYFGSDAITLNDAPFDEFSGIRILGLPFEPVSGEELLGRIQTLGKLLTADRKNILLYHGELLDAFYSEKSRSDFGEEGEVRYMPLKLSYFEGLNIDYVLAGHFHTSFDVRQLPSGGYFVYPGSPVSITRREVRRRKINIFEVGAPPGEHSLDTFHYEEVPVALDPLTDKHPLEMVKESLKKVHPAAKVILTVAGYINSEQIGITETELDRQLKEIAAAKCADYNCEFKDIRSILEDDLFKSFMQKLEQAGYDEERAKQLRETAIRAMMQARL